MYVCYVWMCVHVTGNCLCVVVAPSQMSAAEREKKEQLIRAWREQKAAIQDQGHTSTHAVHTHSDLLYDAYIYSTH